MRPSPGPIMIGPAGRLMSRPDNLINQPFSQASVL